MNKNKPLVLITGSAGNIGSALTSCLSASYRIVRVERPGVECDVAMDISSAESVAGGLKKIAKNYGKSFAAVVHLAAYFDFSGEASPLYQKVNVDGCKNMIDGLKGFEVERFIYASTMLVHQPAALGETINEDSPIAPQWAYPQSKAEAEKVIEQNAGSMPYLILRLAGLYDDQTCVPTLAQQIIRIFEQDSQSAFYAGDVRTGQAFIHQQDLLDLFKKAIAHRNKLPQACVILAGEPETVSYQTLQNQIGQLIHGVQKWKTFSLPKSVAKVGAWLQQKSEPLVPDVIDQGEKPFIRPFMVELASHHYALSIHRAIELLGWQPQLSIKQALPKIIEALKANPLEWYRLHNATPPQWMQASAEQKQNPFELSIHYETDYRKIHGQFLWAHLLNISLGFSLMCSPFYLDYQSENLTRSDLLSGLIIVIFGSLSLSPDRHLRHCRWIVGLTGLWLLLAPLVFWTSSAAAYLNDTLVGSLVVALSLLARPLPGISPIAALTGPIIPPGWNFSPSSWVQRLPIIILAFVGFFVSRYLAAYQLGHIDSVWEPFFAGYPDDPKNGTEEIITSHVSKAWPVSDAGMGGLTYILEILTGIIGSNKRWRTMPWLVLLFGFMIVPLGAISITFIIIQPIILSTWCTLCLIAAAAMLIQIPYSIDEIVATILFLKRRAKLGKSWLLILFIGDTDEESDSKSNSKNANKNDNKNEKSSDEFSRPLAHIVKDIFAGGVSMPWNLTLCSAIGVWLMFTRITLGNEGNMANADHLIGALVVTITVTSFAEVLRSLRFVNIFLGLSLLITPFIFDAELSAQIVTLICGLGLIVLCLGRGKIRNSYGNWSDAIV